jgi:toxin ParE1/3/4
MAHLLATSAESDLDDIWYYVAKESGDPDRAEHFIASLTERFYLLSANPFIGRSRDDLRPGLRTFPVGQHVIVYRVENEDVVILHVFHGSRDIESFFHH